MFTTQLRKQEVQEEKGNLGCATYRTNTCCLVIVIVPKQKLLFSNFSSGEDEGKERSEASVRRRLGYEIHLQGDE